MFLVALVCLSFFVQIWDFGAPGLFIFFLKYSFFLLFIFDCAGSSLLLRSLSLVGGAGTAPLAALTLLLSALLFCGARAPGAQTQQLWLAGFSCSVLHGLFPNQG